MIELCKLFGYVYYYDPHHPIVVRGPNFTIGLHDTFLISLSIYDIAKNDNYLRIYEYQIQ